MPALQTKHAQGCHSWCRPMAMVTHQLQRTPPPAPQAAAVPAGPASAGEARAQRARGCSAQTCLQGRCGGVGRWRCLLRINVQD